MLILGLREKSFVKIVVPPSDGPTEVLVGLQDVRASRVRVAFKAPRCVVISRGFNDQGDPVVKGADFREDPDPVPEKVVGSSGVACGNGFHESSR